MTIRHIYYTIGILAVVFLAVKLYPSNEIIHPHGVMVDEYPRMHDLEKELSWEKNGYNISALKKVYIKAIVLSKEYYYLDRESDLSPCDLALGWGSMSNQKNLEKINISQGRRWFFWDSPNMPIPIQETEKNSTNAHIIPASINVENILDDIKKGNIIVLEGYLVKAEATDGWSWVSSTSWNDTKGGACELIWTENITIQEN